MVIVAVIMINAPTHIILKRSDAMSFVILFDTICCGYTATNIVTG